MSMNTHPLETAPAGVAVEWNWSNLSIGSAMLTILLLLVPFLGASQINWLTEEDGVVEWLTAGLFLLAAVVCGLAVWRVAGSQRVGRVVWATLAFLFMGEEVSWFQRVIGFSTPQFLKGNVQGEANFHNLPTLTPHDVDRATDLITSQGLFYVGFLLYFALFPLLCLASSKLGRLAKRWGFFPLPIGAVVAIWVPILVSFAVALALPHGPNRFGLTEIRELLFAVAIAGYAWWSCTQQPVTQQPAASAA